MSETGYIILLGSDKNNFPVITPDGEKNIYHVKLLYMVMMNLMN